MNEKKGLRKEEEIEWKWGQKVKVSKRGKRKCFVWHEPDNNTAWLVIIIILMLMMIISLSFSSGLKFALFSSFTRSWSVPSTQCITRLAFRAILLFLSTLCVCWTKSDLRPNQDNVFIAGLAAGGRRKRNVTTHGSREANFSTRFSFSFRFLYLSILLSSISPFSARILDSQGMSK